VDAAWWRSAVDAARAWELQAVRAIVVPVVSVVSVIVVFIVFIHRSHLQQSPAQ
jgi:hypothetical protein